MRYYHTLSFCQSLFEIFLFFLFTFISISDNIVLQGGGVMKNLKLLRKQHNLSQKEIGNIFHASQNTVSQWENGTRKPSYDIIQEIADYFDVSVDYLLGRQEQLPELNNKDQKEIQKILDETKEQLLSQDGLMFDGVPATEEDVQKIIMAMQMGMEMIKKENKAKFTPKKYRKDN